MSNRQITYYSDCRSIDSISNPIIDNNVGMKYSGFLSTDWEYSDRTYDYGLEKTRTNQGIIFCDDASKLFSSFSGGVEIIIQLPYPIVDGVYQPLNSVCDLNEYLIWGVNVGKSDVSYPSVSLKLTTSGIEFTNWGSAGTFTLTGTPSLSANEDIKIECFWSRSELLESSNTFLRINDTYVVLGNPEPNNDLFTDLNFCLLDSKFLYSNLDCVIKKISISKEKDILPLVPSLDLANSNSISIPFTIDVASNYVSILQEEEIMLVVRSKADFIAHGPNDIEIKNEEEVNAKGELPRRPLPLPNGFEVLK